MSTPPEVPSTESITEGPPLTKREQRSLGRQTLNEYEVFWRDHYVWLKQTGYLLRPRYNPEWIPSWKGTTESYLLCEDGQRGKVGCILHCSCIAN